MTWGEYRNTARESTHGWGQETQGWSGAGLVKDREVKKGFCRYVSEGKTRENMEQGCWAGLG